MEPTIEQFEALVHQLMSGENDVRKNAEAAFQEMKKTPLYLCSSLVKLVRSSQHEAIRGLASVLLRRVIGRGTESVWEQLDQPNQAFVKTNLLEALRTEPIAHVRSKLGDAVAELAVSIPGQWPELLPFLFQATKSERETDRETALLIFSQLAPEIGESLRTHFTVLRGVLSAGLSDSNLKVRIAALTATANFLQYLNEPSERTQFQQLLPMMLGCVSSALNAQQEDEARAALELFVDLAELDPTFLRPCLNEIIPAMQHIATVASLEESTQQLGVEFLITLAENKPGMARRHPKFVDTLVPILLKMMVGIDDNHAWNTGDDEDEVEITASDIGEESLDRLALALGGKILVPILFGLLPQLMRDQNWKHRHTALMAISIIGEGCNKQLAPGLAEIIKQILPFFSDSHPRVRWAACNTAGQMASDFGPEFQQNFHSQILPVLVAVMDDRENPRVQSHAASAVINFCEHASSEILLPYVELLLTKLMALLQGGRTIVQEQVVTAIAAIADCIQADFARYYDAVMPFLKNILLNANTKEFRTLRGKAMECCTLIGVAVGKDKFYPDAKDIMEMMLKTQTTVLDNDDPQVGFLLQAWARICRCLGKDFVPYLGHVMPPLLQSAKLSPDVTVYDSDNVQEQEGWEFIPVGDKRIGINTSVLEEKSTACNMIFCYASELEEGFFPYVDETTKLLVPLLRFFYHDGVRSAAVTTMPCLITSASRYFATTGGQDNSYVRNLFNFMFVPFLEAMKEEIDMEILVLAIESFVECLDVVGENALTDEQMAQVAEVLLELLGEMQVRRHERNSRKSEEDHDDEEEERISDEEERDQEISSGIAETIGHLAKLQKNNFIPFFDKFVPLLVELLKPTSQESDRQMALCIFDDLCEFQRERALPYFPHFLPQLLAYIGDEDPTVRQAAVYGAGIVVSVGGPHIASAIPEILARLTAVITSPTARAEGFANPTENAIAAVGKILQFQSGVIDASSTFQQWLSWLPVTSDKIESKVTYAQFCQFIESNNPHMLGPNGANLPKIIQVMATVLFTDLIDEDLHKRIVNILKNIQQGGSPLLQQAWQSLTPELQAKLQRAIS
eukprot:TRINITY_DN1791_c0_g1_i1.p1 TRINITY_DN1791_c0_g1~~TRINITY_DN1791_c0_g1_i1.p1  ORF type:complete len:1082 (-),score=281.10 TRINITY_DN1791_c0_g1_i1:40-3285(-)